MDIFFDGKIYVGVEPTSEMMADYEYRNYLGSYESYPVHGSHPFKDGEDVSGRYELQHQLRSFNPNKEEWYTPAYLEDYHTATDGKRIIAVAIPTPDKSIEEEAKDLVEKFYNEIEDAKAGMFDEDVPYVEARALAARKCASLHCDLIIDEIRAIYLIAFHKTVDMDNTKVFHDRIFYYTNLKHSIEQL